MPTKDSPKPLRAAIASHAAIIVVAAGAFVAAVIGVGTYVLDRPWLGWGNMAQGTVKYSLFAAACLYVAMDQGMVVRDLIRRSKWRKAANNAAPDGAMPPYGHWLDNAADDAALSDRVLPTTPPQTPQDPDVPGQPDRPRDGR